LRDSSILADTAVSKHIEGSDKLPLGFRVGDALVNCTDSRPLGCNLAS
jgi:hypothetical protein